jgi:excisionase family DNA binding protein
MSAFLLKNRPFHRCPSSLLSPRGYYVVTMWSCLQVISTYFRSSFSKFQIMGTNIIMLQKDDLKEVLAEVLKEVLDGQSTERQSSGTVSEYYTRDEACARLHITFTTLWRLEKKGSIHAYKVGRRCLYAKNDVDALIASSTSCETPLNKKGE